MMGRIPANNECPVSKGIVELNNHLLNEHKELKDGVVGEGQGLSEEDESRINEVAEDANKGHGGVAQLQTGLQRPTQQTQGPVVHWERFLPLRSPKVLLVENDDSTRHVVSALLRNCSYEVIAVANGIQAWKVLEDLTNRVDIILTEVVMPCFSGINLLSKIMSHKTCKNIPVIMMSSHDSMGIVFKCLSKGAVDFLVKPIRKNELKNLWQHVWRRCHSSSGSVSESGIGTQKSAKSKSIEESDNNTASSNEDDNGSIGLNDRDGSDKGSGTQSSWTKRAVEVDSPQPMSPWNQVTDPPDSTCAQVIYPKPETFGSEWFHIVKTKEHQEQDQHLDNVAMGKDLEIGVPRNPDSQQKYQRGKVLINLAGTKQDNLPELDPKINSKQTHKEQLELKSVNPTDNLRDQAADLIGVIANGTNPLVERQISEEAPDGISKTSEMKDKATSDARELPSLELSLKRQGMDDMGIGTHDERNVLRHSDLSAFSRYNTASTANPAPTGNVGSCSPIDNSSEAVKMDSMHNFPSHSNGTPPNQQSHESSNNIDMASTTNNVFTKPAAFNEKSGSMSTAKCLHPSAAFQPLQNGCMHPSQKVIREKSDDVVVKTLLTQPRGSQQQVQVQHHHHHYHHYHHHVHNTQQQQPQQQQQQQQQQTPANDELSLNMATVDPQCGSSNMFSGLVEGNAANYSVNGSASGSNHGSNGQNGSSTAMNAGAMNLESDNGVAGKNGAGDGSGGGSGSGSGVDQNRFAQREAALTKFRQKRKERCFEKKVRYQSRKRLAEQRPRVRGQFVRQVANDNTSGDADS